MNTEAVEYVRGIPVVKVFQQTVFSFKNFHDSIMRYKDMVFKYTLMWELPMSAYTAIIHGFVYLLIPVGILLIGNPGTPAQVILDLLFYILITPVFAQCIMRSMHLNHCRGPGLRGRYPDRGIDYGGTACRSRKSPGDHRPQHRFQGCLVLLSGRREKGAGRYHV